MDRTFAKTTFIGAVFTASLWCLHAEGAPEAILVAAQDKGQGDEHKADQAKETVYEGENDTTIGVIKHKVVKSDEKYTDMVTISPIQPRDPSKGRNPDQGPFSFSRAPGASVSEKEKRIEVFAGFLPSAIPVGSSFHNGYFIAIFVTECTKITFKPFVNDSPPRFPDKDWTADGKEQTGGDVKNTKSEKVGQVFVDSPGVTGTLPQGKTFSKNEAFRTIILCDGVENSMITWGYSATWTGDANNSFETTASSSDRPKWLKAGTKEYDDARKPLK